MEQTLAPWGGEKMRKTAIAALALLALFLAVESIKGFKELRYVGAGLVATNTITVSGDGEAYAVPDIATFNFSVVSEKKTVADAQEDAAKKIDAISAYLEEAGIEDKDIKTTGYNIYPQYDYSSSVCPRGGTLESVVYCPPGKSVLRGYEVRQTTQIKVRDTAKAGELLSGVGSRGASEVSGLSFTVEDSSAIEEEARGEAIAAAKAKAKKLSKELGVSLVRVVSFNESGTGTPSPLYYGYGAGDAIAESAKATPDISTGENTFKSYVSITYEIR